MNERRNSLERAAAYDPAFERKLADAIVRIASISR